MSFAISNHSSGELLQLAWYATDETDSHELQNILGAHPELRHSFYAIQIAYDYPQSVLVPLQAYKQDDARLLAEVMHGVNGSHTIVAEAVPGWQIQHAYAIPAGVHDWVTAHFPAAHYRHNYSLGIGQVAGCDAGGLIVADFHTHYFSVIAGKENKLLLAQTFSYAAAADVVYYLLQTCEAFSLSQENVQLAISGLIEKDSGLYRSLMQYFLHIRFREPGWELPAGHDIPAHFFTSLNDLASCAS